MKNLRSIPFFVLVLSTLAFAVESNPLADRDCARTRGGHCEEGEHFYFTHDDRCGCVPEAKVIPREQCDETITCSEPTETFTKLYIRVERCGMHEVMVGCGCFKTI